MNRETTTTKTAAPWPPDQPQAQAPAAAHLLSSAPIHYRVQIIDASTHCFHVTLTIAQPAGSQIVLLPVWIPGSYLVREFSKSLRGLVARQDGQSVPLRQLDKHRWQIEADTSRPLVLNYQIHALDASVRSAWLDADRGFFNGTSLFLLVEQQQHLPHELALVASEALPGWRVATALPALRIDAAGFGSYRAADYEQLVDCPVELGAFFSGSFEARALPHRFVVAGAAASFDRERLLADAQKICETQLAFWHPHGEPAPFADYVFMLNVVADGYGGLEHRNSTALIANRADLPRVKAARVAQQPADPLDREAAVTTGDAELNHALALVRAAAAEESGGAAALDDGYVTLLGLISHEYFHAWNVKRLRPAEFARYDFTRENYTRLLWFFEGFTSYYDDLLLRRAGLIGDAAYLKLLGKTINQVRQTPGRRVQSVADASFDAWVKYYRPDADTPNGTVSYYSKGALVALCLDLSLRAESVSNGGGAQASLDDAMRALWSRCKAGPMTEDDLLAVLRQVGGRSYADELAAWVHGTEELPLERLLATQGVVVQAQTSPFAQRLGLRVQEGAAATVGGIVVKTVLAGGVAERAGLAPGDEWIGIALPPATTDQAPAARSTGWRLRKLDELPLYLGETVTFDAIVARDSRLLQLPLMLMPDEPTWRLSLRHAEQARAWLAGVSAAQATS